MSKTYHNWDPKPIEDAWLIRDRMDVVCAAVLYYEQEGAWAVWPFPNLGDYMFFKYKLVGAPHCPGPTSRRFHRERKPRQRKAKKA